MIFLVNGLLQHCIIDQKKEKICLPDGKTYVQIHAYCSVLKQDNDVMIKPTEVKECNLYTNSNETKAEIKEKYKNRIIIIKQFPKTKKFRITKKKSRSIA